MLLGVALATTRFVRADAYDTCRQKWSDNYTGGTSYNTSDPYISARITQFDSTANSNWSSMLKGDTTRPYLWSDLTSWSTTESQISTMAYRLETMANSYATRGSTLYGNTSLLTDIIGGLDWLVANAYNPSTPEYGNWWYWEIGIPRHLDNVMVLAYAGMNATQISNYCAAISYYTPAPKGTGANLVWTCQVVEGVGIISKDSKKMSAASSGLSPVFQYSTGDGFHTDGSFLQHTGRFPYNGGYGFDLLGTLPSVITVLQGSPWAVTDPAQSNMYQWVYNAFAPLIYKGGFMSMTCGRDISRSNSEEHSVGHSAMEDLLDWVSMASASDALAYKQMIKYWAQQDTFESYVPNVWSLGHIAAAEALMADNTISPENEPVMNKPYPEMDRAVHLRPGFGFGISMYSTRISNYESINGENLQGWYTASGMTYLYNADLAAYDNNFWPTVNPYRLPGTTVTTQSEANSAYSGTFSTQSWVGSANVLGLYGVAGMQLIQQGSTLTANKSWFMFDDEIVALGSNINCSDTSPVETIVENRQINASGSNALTVNGTAQSTAMPWSATLNNVNWIHLAGSAASGADIGYYFPTTSTINAVRESRTSSWSIIGTGSTSSVTDDYVTLWFDHGSKPNGASYAYVLLPNMTPTQVAAYASKPDIQILENSSSAHAVKETTLNVVAANFWQDVSHTVDIITSDKKATVIAQQNTGQDITIAVADPTQLGSSINVGIALNATGIMSADSTITVTQLSPTIKFAVNVNGSLGHTRNVKFSLATPTSPPPAPTGLTATAGGSSQINLSWTAASGAASYNVLRSTTNGGPYASVATSVLTPSYSDTGLAGSTTYYYVVQAVNSLGTSANSAQASATTSAALSTTLSINFQGGSSTNGTPSVMASTEAAGVVAASNWNNATGASGSLTSLKDANGVATGVSVSWSSNNIWSTSITDTAGNNRMMKGYLDTSNTSTTSVTISGLPASYTVYVYCDGDNGSTTKTGRYTIGSTTITATDNANTNFSGTFTQANNSAGNYVVFTNQTASSITVTAAGTSTDSGPRAPINGIQIVPTSTTPPPAAPTGLTATAVSSTQINLAWTASGGATGYNVKVATVSGGPYITIASGITATTYSDTSAAPGVTSYYVVSAFNSGGESANSTQASAMTPPAAPTGLSATAGNAQVSLAWTASTGTTSYNVKRATVNGGPYTTIASPTTTSYTDTTAVNGTTYYYVVAATNAAGTSTNSTQVSATPSAPTVPAAPSGLTATAGKRKISLAWNASSGAISYNAKRSSVSGGPYTTIATGITTTSYTDSGLSTGSTYYYVVSAVNSVGESANSNQASATAK